MNFNILLSHCCFTFFIIIHFLASFFDLDLLITHILRVYITLIFLIIKKYISIKYHNLRNIQYRFYYLINDFYKKICINDQQSCLIVNKIINIKTCWFLLYNKISIKFHSNQTFYCYKHFQIFQLIYLSNIKYVI